jgi:hypothetical protein
MPNDPDILADIDTEAPAKPAIPSLVTVVGDDIYPRSTGTPVTAIRQSLGAKADRRTQDWTNAGLGREWVQCVDGRHDSPLVR